MSTILIQFIWIVALELDIENKRFQSMEKPFWIICINKNITRRRNLFGIITVFYELLEVIALLFM